MKFSQIIILLESFAICSVIKIIWSPPLCNHKDTNDSAYWYINALKHINSSVHRIVGKFGGEKFGELTLRAFGKRKFGELIDQPIDY